MDLFPGLPYELGLECLLRIPHHCLSSAVRVCRNWRREIQLPEFWGRRKASGLTQRAIVMVQSRVGPNLEFGPNCLTLCEPETSFWAQLPPLPEFPDGLPMYCQVVAAGLNLVVMGGWDPLTFRFSNSVFIYNLISGRWRRGADMPGGPRLFFACASDSDRMVFVAGGHDASEHALKSAMAYDVVNNNWIQLRDMTRERAECKGVYYRGEFRIIGGYETNLQGNFEMSAESFDVATWQWGPMQVDFQDMAASPINCADNGDGVLIMCRGNDVVVQRVSTWSTVAELPPEVRNVGFMAAWQDKVLVTGSQRFSSIYRTLMLDLQSGIWEGVDGWENFTGLVQSGCCLEV